MGVLRSTYVPANLIPRDKDDFDGGQRAVSSLGGFIPFLGGAPLDVILGLAGNAGEGKNLLHQIPLSKPTVTKSITGVYYTYALSVWLFRTIGQYAGIPALAPVQLIPGVNEFNPVRMISTVLTLPLTYGITTYHNVVRSMCFTDDDTTGSGLGAEAHKRKDEAAENIAGTRKGRRRAPEPPGRRAQPPPRSRPGFGCGRVHAHRNRHPKTTAPKRRPTPTTPCRRGFTPDLPKLNQKPRNDRKVFGASSVRNRLYSPTVTADGEKAYTSVSPMAQAIVATTSPE